MCYYLNVHFQGQRVKVFVFIISSLVILYSDDYIFGDLGIFDL